MSEIEIASGYDKLYFMRSSSNDKAHRVVEDYFGLSFKKPDRFIRTPYNMLVLGLNGFVNGDPGLVFRHLRANGCWDPIYNVYGVKETSGFLTDVHEEVHSLNDQLNPKINNEAFQLILSCAGKADRRDSTCAASYGSLDEGIAYFVEMEIGFYSGDSLMFRKAMEIKDGLLHGISQKVRFSSDQKWRDLVFYVLSQSVELINGNFDDKGNGNLKKAFEVQMKVRDIAGFNFVFHALSYLRQRYELTNPQGLLYLIKNPPQTIEKLKDPVGYLSGLSYP